MDLLAPTRIRSELDQVTRHWTPRVVGQVNDQFVKVAKLLGEFVWHAHDEQDEMFLIVYGRLRIQLQGDREVVLEPGEFYVVPKGTRHNPVADEEVGIVLIETVTTAHTGDVVDARSVPIDQQVAPS
ncbi:mannose-6-phosphate isomerase-like protein (cupin superfamily) [Frondihabitans sp. PhB188]|uniref:cupin domain-containing protein n=1 Tax=Frondihabitans sp. PhB188 TaxID=2485200 RepID=UPI000F48F15C|nr:cupin domain-containing protein [Frondihabitans sp. PhB188]ROQ40007.1 mannose-6-phosphate isomerase-like protein (cupin superfamily) [Frondihabitans sp. PhB188]